jgi:hypothetical protein
MTPANSTSAAHGNATGRLFQTARTFSRAWVEFLRPSGLKADFMSLDRRNKIG